MFFYGFLLFLALQRAAELALAKSNEAAMKKNGGREYGASHYPWMVAMHAGYFLSLTAEHMTFGRGLSAVWPVWFGIFILLQAGRVWVISSLGRFWNTKIIVMPDASPVEKGPYKYVKHPNYVIVAGEILVIALLFQAYATAIVFSLLNAWMMSVRIPAEEEALQIMDDYPAAGKNRKE